MKAGASARTLAFPEHYFPVEGFSKVIDPLRARVLVLEQDLRCAILVLDMTSLPPEEIDALSGILKAETGAAYTVCLVTHTFSAPHFMPDGRLKTQAERDRKRTLQEIVYQAVRETAAEAVRKLRRITIHRGSAQCLVNSPRDVETPMGWWVGSNGTGAVDHTMTAVRLTDDAGQDAAVLIHYPVQSSVLDGSILRSGGKAVSGDLAGILAASLEADLGCPVLFLIGAAGDQAPRKKAVEVTATPEGTLEFTDMQDDAIALCAELAREMKDAATAALGNASPDEADCLTWRQSAVEVPGKKMERELQKLRPTRVPPYQADGHCVQTVDLLQIGSLKLIGVKPELNCATAAQISGEDDSVKVVTLWNGGAKYMADAASYDRITYESQNSPFMKGAAELLTQAAKEIRDL